MKRTIKISEFKRVNVAVSEEQIAELFIAPVYESTWFTAQDLAEVKYFIESDAAINKWMNSSSIDQSVKLAVESLLNYNNDKLVSILNSIDSQEDYLNAMVGKLMDRLDAPNLPMAEFRLSEIRGNMAYQLLRVLVDTNKATIREDLTWVADGESGKGEWKLQQRVTFGQAKTKCPMYTKGLSMKPGVVNQKRYKVQAGGKARKLGKAEKEILTIASSFKLRMVDIPLELLERYMKNSEWYTNILHGKVDNMDKIQADELVYNALCKYARINSLDGFYLPMWLDYRTRMYYDFTELGLNPHGKHFETSLFEAAEPYYIKEIEEYKYSAVVLTDGRMPHHTAVELFDANPDHYLAALRTPLSDKADVEEIGDFLYNSRLADAIESYYAGEPTHFLLGEDATNGGLQHGGIGFHSSEMMIPSNVGGAYEQRDSHGDLQATLGLAERQLAKDIHQPLLHGSSLNTVAKVINKPLMATRQMLEDAYGASVFNIAKIADWGVSIANNANTSLLWKTRDGLFAQSIAYVESVPMNFKCLTSSNKQGWSQLKVTKDMPLLKDIKGQVVYGKVADDKTTGGDIKNRGLYANITHSIDGTALREVMRAMHSIGKGGLWKHDNFLVPGDMELVRHSYKAALLAEFDAPQYESAMIQIVENYTGTTPPIPHLVYGHATKDQIINSHYYLAP